MTKGNGLIMNCDSKLKNYKLFTDVFFTILNNRNLKVFKVSLSTVIYKRERLFSEYSKIQKLTYILW